MGVRLGSSTDARGGAQGQGLQGGRVGTGDGFYLHPPSGGDPEPRRGQGGERRWGLGAETMALAQGGCVGAVTEAAVGVVSSPERCLRPVRCSGSNRQDVSEGGSRLLLCPVWRSGTQGPVARPLPLWVEL